MNAFSRTIPILFLAALPVVGERAPTGHSSSSLVEADSIRGQGGHSATWGIDGVPKWPGEQAQRILRARVAIPFAPPRRAS